MSGDAGREDRDPVVLVVDDVPMFRELEMLFLSRFGRVVEAKNAAEALRLAAQHAPDIVVLDHGLPDARIETVMEALRESPATRETPIVVVTAGRAEEHEAAIRAGASDVVAKPLSRTLLVDSVRRFLHRRDARALPRIPLHTPVHLWNAQRDAWGIARNVSRGGMFIESDWLPPTDTELRLAFQLAQTGRPLQSTAKLIWRRLRPVDGPPGIGVRFLALDGPASRELDAFVHEHRTRAVDEPYPDARRRPRIEGATG